MTMIPWKTVRSWVLRASALALAVAPILVLFGGGRAAAGSTASRAALPIQNGMTLTCRIETFATLNGDSKAIQGKISAGGAPLTFKVVDGHLLKFDPEPMRLRLLSTSRASSSMFFELLTADSNAQLWSFHRLQGGRILYSGQLSMNDSGPTAESVMVWTQAGFCDAIGGNGQPVRE